MRKHKWTRAQRAKFKATMAARELDRERAEAEEAHAERYESMRPLSEHPSLHEQPDIIFVLLNGKLQQFTLRTMSVYIPTEYLE